MKGDETVLRQARYALRNLHKQHPLCGYGKMAAACERAADRMMKRRHRREADSNMRQDR